MRIYVTSVLVDDQDKALKFYTETLGFQFKRHIPKVRWLTVVSPDSPDGVELLLEPNSNPASQTFQSAIFAQGIPATLFEVDDIQAECARLKALGVSFTMEPTDVGDYTMAIFNDTCGNLIGIIQQSGE